MHIDAIPTEYRSLLFRSRLEARTAVLLDSLPNVLSWLYEPTTISYSVTSKTGKRRSRINYTPDFSVVYYVTGNRHECLLEIKPIDPNTQYLEKLTEVSKHTPFPIVLLTPNYYEKEVACYYYHHGTEDSGFNIFQHFPDIGVAFHKASAYRFDL